jgi:hypothetical protein
MKPKEVIARIPKSKFVENYITLWNGGLKLTDKEQEVLVVVIDTYNEILLATKEPFASELLFSTKSRKVMMEKLGLNPQGFNNYFKGLKDKGVIFEKDDYYQLNPIIIPQTEILFKFILDEGV